MKWYWHIHHDTLCELATESIARRRAYIKTDKPKNEVALRLRLLKPVRGPLPAQLAKAGVAYVKALVAYNKAWDACDKVGASYDKAKADYALGKASDAYAKASDAYAKARAVYQRELEALHRKECPNCPWDGTTIFHKMTP